MSRFHNRNFELLEPYDAKVSRTVLRGEGSSNAPDLLDLFLDNSDENLRQFERTARNMQSLAQYSRSNQINKEWIDDYLNEAHSFSLTSIRAHFNVMAWGEGSEELKQIRNDVGAQLALMGCTPRHNTVDVPTLFWAAIPGNEGDFPAEESFYTFLEQGLCLFNEETNYRSSLSPFGIKMADRVSGIPIHLDISDYPMKKGWISNRNRVVIGPSGGGKSFILNHICRQYYEQGAHIVIVDTGNSYQGLCSLIRQKTKGRDGIYFTYQEDAPVAFNPFFVEDGVYDVEKRESLKALLLTLWKRESEEPTRAEEVALSNAVNLYLSQLKTGTAVTPSFNTFYEFVATDYRRLLEKKRVREKDFDIENFLNVLEPYYRGGEYDYLLNSDKQLDLLDKRFIVFELDNISENKVLYPVITLIDDHQGITGRQVCQSNDQHQYDHPQPHQIDYRQTMYMFTDHQVIRKNSRQQFQTIRPEIIKSNKQNRRQNSQPQSHNILQGRTARKEQDPESPSDQQDKLRINSNGQGD